MIDLKEKLAGYEFSPEGGRAVWQYTHALLVGGYNIPYEKWPMPWPNSQIIVAADCKNHAVKWYFVFTSTKVFTDFLDEVLKDKQLLPKIENYITTQKEEGVFELKGVDVSGLSNGELSQKITHYFNYFQHLLLVASNIRSVDRAILSVVRTKYPDRADEILRMSSILTRPSFAVQEEIALLTSAAKIKKGLISESNIQNEAQEIHDSYAWSVMGYHDEKPKTLTYYVEKINSLLSGNPEKSLEELQGKIKHDQEERTKYVAGLSAEDQILADIAAYSAYLKDYFKSSINELEYFAEPLFDELERRFGLPKNYIKDLIPEEIFALFEGKRPDQAAFDERVRHNVIFYGFGEVLNFDGKAADEFEKAYLLVEKSTAKTFKGRVACKGKVSGKVAVVKGHEDFHKLQQGNVLVVMNTSPDYVPILGKAVAIIAEEGGLTAHVSVISREFGIPCIVGVQNITQNLKDGDLVEVDADQGMIKIL